MPEGDEIRPCQHNCRSGDDDGKKYSGDPCQSRLNVNFAGEGWYVRKNGPEICLTTGYHTEALLECQAHACEDNEVLANEYYPRSLATLISEFQSQI